MKKIAFLSMVIAIALVGCKKEQPTLDEPGSKLEGINATWQMVEVIQVDEASISKDELDVSNAFIAGTPMEITINSADFTYTVNNTSGPNYFGNAGTWAFDDNEFPTKVTLTTETTEVIDLPLVRTIRPQDVHLEIKHFRKCGNDEEAYIAYKFKFSRVN